ncbi:MAG: signal peptidase I [Candidatus Raymondbacteria bacterium RifOxyA12_full_50_37]|uniref:Signal peptidase I n=1 Tax=Candidatus Raymondbacteria bacterium RIFOXYD12_FULL_49_13 TaxID=1817890 RepID=A0A1F7F6V1_UNCRA|nr:MAG: signal peptidase I [Candidatus Raymondbacteria bacterium RifOxyA12_full_50_37]OGJ87300.1 MAG: signal peptidase I [Candidatus Raymondbacteria bacterium RifOxyB12_full_50_8]OGJ88450.1 MAG: signal peptidase I [Candidatus Raymondbacteria bacterium RIFOXYA2_FULL_49_16]OGJ98910.1 MAG: signal peptidase I [Candidatus Raymondbacteria bacterium RIFOXYC2_FULL_50_21]OGK02390.1 MAG: signal peptidase I [Candidatus Raymondbacteria bacterium RIFOXYD12_FULL_49_13]OGP41420.1 MAG: signal peptidase I [Can
MSNDSLKQKIGRFLGLMPLEYAPKNTEKSPKSEFLRVFKDVSTALVMALIVIQFVIQAFKIPSGSMEDSLLVGDFLLGLKYIYGSPIPFTYDKLPGLREPERNDVVIFKFPGDPNYPNNDEKRYIKLINTFVFGVLYWDKEGKSITVHRPKDFIKRCVAKGGDTVEVRDKVLMVNHQEVPEAPMGKHIDSRVMPNAFDPRDTFGPYIVPKKGEVLTLSDARSIREFFWARSLIYQENPTTPMHSVIKLYVNDSLYSEIPYKGALYVKYTNWDWHEMEKQLSLFQQKMPDASVRVAKELYLDGKRITEYTLRYNAFFMMGDNRDNSLDGRYWGFVSKKFVNAKALIIYFSWDSFEPVLSAIRFSRIGKLIF